MTEPTPHPHAEMIAEWIKDTSRIVERFDKDRDVWVDLYPGWGPNEQYRFADTKPKIVSSLTEEEIKEVFYDIGSFLPALRAVANAAAQRAIEDLRLPEFHWFAKIINKDTAMDAITRFIADKKEGKL